MKKNVIAVLLSTVIAVGSVHAVPLSAEEIPNAEAVSSAGDVITDEAGAEEPDAEEAGAEEPDAEESGTEEPDAEESGTEEDSNDSTEGIVAFGTCGNDLEWELDDNGILTISGTGPNVVKR